MSRGQWRPADGLVSEWSELNEQGEVVLNKLSAGTFATTGLEQRLRHQGVQSVVVTGVASDVCVTTTAREAADRGFRTIMVSDACSRHTSFVGADCEFLDGEVVERNMGELPHSTVQMELGFLLRQLTPTLGIQVKPEIRIQITPTRFRVADLAVWRAGEIGTDIPLVPPFLVIEVLSPEDRMVRMQPKIQECLSIGVEYVWLIDPQERQALIYSPQIPGGQLLDVLRTENPAIGIPLVSVLPA